MKTKYRAAALLMAAIAAGMQAAALPGCGGKPEPQQAVGILMLDESRQPVLDGLKDGLERLGFSEGVEVRFVVRNAEDDLRRLVPLAKQLADQKPAVICALGTLEAMAAVPLAESAGVAVVYLGVNNPAGLGISKSDTEPLPNTTGIRSGYGERLPKRMQLATFFFAGLRTVTVLYDPQDPPSARGMRLCEQTAPKLGLMVQSAALASDADVKYFAETLAPGKHQLLLYTPTPLLTRHHKAIIAPAAIRAKVPLFALNKQACLDGAVISFGPSLYGFGSQGAQLVRRILLGSAPETLPIELPEGKELLLCINMKAAQEIGVTFPQRMFELADIVIR